MAAVHYVTSGAGLI